MRWRTKDNRPCDFQDCFLEIENAGYEVGIYCSDGSVWVCASTYDWDDVEKWCPVDEIIEALDTGESENEAKVLIKQGDSINGH